MGDIVCKLLYGGDIMRKLAAIALLTIGSGIVLSAAVVVAPEIDPASGGSALALLTSALLLIRGRRRK
jgi:hypothetical protein